MEMKEIKGKVKFSCDLLETVEDKMEKILQELAGEIGAYSHNITIRDILYYFYGKINEIPGYIYNARMEIDDIKKIDT